MESFQTVTGMTLQQMQNKTLFCNGVSILNPYFIQLERLANLCFGKSEAKVANFGYKAVSDLFSFLCKSDGQNIDSKRFS